ncbi:hypothetical protein [Fuscovulum ytuae]|uniref:DUF3298 domain-containing protein n=1 Tax=Fuscovulum ytuae TaxID=3042299 RepID=A0ABY8Q2L9_9RHOB|nr:hypothetical protein [Fuscovulum sp. YMD61]WGV15080.1 hypothetical protein QF092_12410 [Fuscovulum sp. YMD61]
MTARILLPLLAMVLATPAAAQGTFTPPEGCTTFMTVQSKGCRVSNHFKCTADAPGDQWRTDFDQEGPFFSSRVNYEAEWVESYEIDPPVRQTLDPNPADPASFSDLLATGSDNYIFGLSDDTGERTRVRGADTLTGRVVVIDGIELQETAFNFTETDLAGNVLRRSRGNEYIHPEWRLFFSGPSQWDGGNGNFVPIDGSPLQFIFPGEPGFASTQPLFDCDAVLSSLPLPPKS